jgi:hypothetical protein
MNSRLSVKVVPGASQNKVMGLLGETLKVRVKAPPENGKANTAVLKLVADFLGVPVKRLCICTGHTSPSKVVEIQGMSNQELAGRVSSHFA